MPRTSASRGLARDAGAQQRELDTCDQLYRLSFEASPVAMVVGDPDGVLLEVNDAFCALLGRRREDLVGRHHDEFTHPDDRGLGQVHAALTDQDPSLESRFAKRFLRPDGGVVWAELSMTSVRGPDGGVRRLVHVDDVGARRAARLALEAERTWLAGLVALQREVTALVGDRDAVVARVIAGALELVAEADGAVVALWTDPTDPGRGLDCVAAGGCLDYAVGTHLEVDGSITEAVALGDRAVRVDDVRDDDRPDPDLQRRVGTGATVLAPLLVDGATLGILSTYSRSPGAFDDHVLNLVTTLAHSLAGALRVAEDQRRLADAVELATQRAQAIELASDAVVVRDLDGYVVYWSPSAEQLYGWRPDEALGRDLDELLDTRTSDGGPLDVVRTALREHGTWGGRAAAPLPGRARRDRADPQGAAARPPRPGGRDPHHQHRRHGPPPSRARAARAPRAARGRRPAQDRPHRHARARDQQPALGPVRRPGRPAADGARPRDRWRGAAAGPRLGAADDAPQRGPDAAHRAGDPRDGHGRGRPARRPPPAGRGRRGRAGPPRSARARGRGGRRPRGRRPGAARAPRAGRHEPPHQRRQVRRGLARVRVSTQGATVALEFEDDGPGVPPGFAPRLFERFARAEGASGTRGTGIGLFICRELARANGGDLVHRAGEGGGSVFLLELSRNDDGREDCRQG